MKNEMTVYDAEKGKMVKTNPDRVAMAKHLNGVVRGASIAMAIGIGEIFDNKYYRELGCASQEEYCQLHLEFGFSVAKRYAAVGRAIRPMLGEIKPGESIAVIAENGAPVHQNENETGEIQSETPVVENHLEAFGGLGIRKMYDLVRAESVDMDDVIKRGKVVFEDGREIDLMDFEAMSARDAQALLNAKSKAQDARVAEVEEKLKLMRSEHATEKSELMSLRKGAKDAKKVEALYGPQANRASALQNQLGIAEALFNQFQLAVFGCKVNDTTDPALQMRFFNLYMEQQRMEVRVRSNYNKVIMDCGELVEADLIPHAAGLIVGAGGEEFALPPISELPAPESYSQGDGEVSDFPMLQRVDIEMSNNGDE